MKRLLTLLALVLCSCSETFVGEEMARQNNENLPDLTAGFADEGTRTYVENGEYLRWHEDDRLAVFFGNTLNRQYKFNGATGANSGTFSLVPSGELGTGNTLDAIYAIYPYSADVRIADGGDISLTLPAEQAYAENSFGRGANTMIAVTENVADTFLAFKNACGYLKLKLYNTDGATIQSIEVEGNGGEKIAGSATATIAFGEAPQLTMAEGATTLVALDCGEGVALGTTAETATEFWITIPATTFESGITVTVTDVNGAIFEKSTDKEIVIERNAIQPMVALEVECKEPVQSNNQIWYTTTDGQPLTLPSDFYLEADWQSADVVSNVYKNGRGIITCDSDIIGIGRYAFNNCQNLESIILPKRVTKLSAYAFTMCSNLVNVSLPETLTTIEGEVFYYCSSLQSITIPDSVTSIGEDCFAGCVNLESICGKYSSSDNRCLIKDGVLLGFAPAGLTMYTIPDGVTKIGYGAFKRFENLTNITIPEGVKKISTDAFYKCTGLTSITLPSSIDELYMTAFGDCSSLEKVYCRAQIPPSIDADYGPFVNCSANLNIYVPSGSVSAYKSATRWSRYASIIKSDPMVYTELGAYDPSKYITYVEDYEYVGSGTAFDYDMYYYGTTIYASGLARATKLECKFCLNDFSSGAFYISVAEDDDSLYKLYLNSNGLNFYDVTSDLYSWSDMGVSKTDVITLTLSDSSVIVNGKTISGTPSVGYYLEGYIWSGHYHERDDGMWWMDYTFQDGAKIYYAKGWDSNGNLVYLGNASLSADGRACWKSTYSDSRTGNIVTQEHFPRVTSSFGRGNL